MRKTLFAIAAFTLTVWGVQAPAADLKDCSKIKNTKQRLDCEEQNITTLKTAVDTLTSQLNTTLSKAIKNGDTVMLNGIAVGQCVTAVTQDGAVLARPCNAENGKWAKYTISQTTASPPAAAAPPAPSSPIANPPPKGDKPCPGGASAC
jgi:hypothetical protein